MGYWPDFNLERVFIFKNIFNMKNVTYFRKTVETGVDPHLKFFIAVKHTTVLCRRMLTFWSYPAVNIALTAFLLYFVFRKPF